jgi:hypothetical protein
MSFKHRDHAAESLIRGSRKFIVHKSSSKQLKIRIILSTFWCFKMTSTVHLKKRCGHSSWPAHPVPAHKWSNLPVSLGLQVAQSAPGTTGRHLTLAHMIRPADFMSSFRQHGHADWRRTWANGRRGGRPSRLGSSSGRALQWLRLARHA